MSTSSASLPHRPHAEPQGSEAPSFRNGRKPRPSDVFIAVMGVTGAGKSSFIATCSGKLVQIGDDLQACTSRVDVFAYEMTPGRTVYLIDTPGFDDTNRSDTQVLTEIARWLVDSYRNEVLLHGIIYLHRITDVRMSGSAKRNLLMFKQLCGDDYLKKVILVTTMWDKVSDSASENREQSGKEIIHKLASHDPPIVTEIQRELVDESRELGQTAAGQEIEGELRKLQKEWAAEKQNLEKNIEEAKRQQDREAEEMMREERDKYTDMLKKLEEERAAMRATLETLLAQREMREMSEVKIKEEMKRQEKAYKNDMSQLKKKQEDLERETAALKSQQTRGEEARKNATEKQQRAENVHAVRVEPMMSGANGMHAHFCLSAFGPYYAFIGDHHRMVNCRDLAPRMGSARLEVCTFGDNGQWVARYSNKRWSLSAGLGLLYPYFASKIAINGLQSLEFCVLGPAQQYFARWLDGSTSCWASDELTAKLKEHGSKIRTMAFGFGNTYFYSFESGRKRGALSWVSNVNDWYYPSLSAWLADHNSVSILAVALDPHRPDSFAIVYVHNNRNDGYRFGVQWPDDIFHDDFDEWWHLECES